MQLSIIICTRNRAESLRCTLESIGKSSVPEGWTVEVLVVDNGSTDQTEQMVRRTNYSQMSAKYIREPRVGKGYAYNAGISAAIGEVLLFTDDDVRVPTRWIEEMCRPILNGTADAVAGGVVYPAEYAAALSKPVISSRRSWFGSTEELDPRQPVSMVGANMAFHRRVLQKVPQFDVELGPGALGFADESLFSFQLLAAGYKLIGAFDVSAEHHFDLTRLTREGLLDLARKMGRSHAFIFHHWQHQRSRLVVPRLGLCHLVRYWTRCFNHGDNVPGGISERALQLEYDLAFYREYIVQRRRQHKYPLRNPVMQFDYKQPGLAGN